MWSKRITVFLLLGVCALLGVDVYSDLRHGSDLSHIAAETAAFLTLLGILVALIKTLQREMRAGQQRLRFELGLLKEERDRWKAQAGEFLAGLGVAIDRQFNSWGLSRAEKEIALLILKGLSHKEIAEIRQTSERTARQQAAAVYAKAGLESKSQLAAFFLEDLMLPPEVPSR